MLVTQQGGQRGGIHFGSGGQFGNISIGDVAGRDIIKTGDISGSGSAIGRGARSDVRTIDTGGGDYAEGDIDKRRGTFVGGDQFNMSGNFSGAILNSKSTLTNVSQSIGAAPHGDAATKAQLQQLIAELSAELQKVPASRRRTPRQSLRPPKPSWSRRPGRSRIRPWYRSAPKGSSRPRRTWRRCCQRCCRWRRKTQWPCCAWLGDADSD